MPPSYTLSKKQRKEEEKRREKREREGERRRRHGEDAEEGALGVPVGGAGGVEPSQDPLTQTVPVPLGPTVHRADEEARVESPMTRIGRACVVPGSAGGGGGVEKRGRGRPRKLPVGSAPATDAPTATSAQVVLLPDSVPDVPAPARDGEVVLLPDSLPDVPAPAPVVLLPDSSPDVPAPARDWDATLSHTVCPAPASSEEVVLPPIMVSPTPSPSGVPLASNPTDGPVAAAPATHIADSTPFRNVEELGDGRLLFAEQVIEESHANIANIIALGPSLAAGFNTPGVEHCLHANELDAYLMALTHLRRQPATVVRTASEHFRALQHQQARAEEAPLRAANFAYGEVGTADVILIPRLNYHAPAGLVNVSNTTGHFTLGVYYPQTGVVHHYDPMQTQVDNNMKSYYRRVVESLHPEGGHPFRFSRVMQRPSSSFNRQNDGVNCGFHVALLGELVLRLGHDRTYIPRWGPSELQQQRIRVSDFLRGVIEGFIPDYHPRRLHSAELHPCLAGSQLPQAVPERNLIGQMLSKPMSNRRLHRTVRVDLSSTLRDVRIWNRIRQSYGR